VFQAGPSEGRWYVAVERLADSAAADSITSIHGLRILMAYLLAENGPDMGIRYPVEVDELTIGRHPNCQISVKDSGRVSRTHAQIIRQGDAYFLKDLLSRNGTSLNRQPISDQLHPLNDGDLIGICDLEFRMAPSC
jgi:hypothetical protein